MKIESRRKEVGLAGTVKREDRGTRGMRWKEWEWDRPRQSGVKTSGCFLSRILSLRLTGVIPSLENFLPSLLPLSLSLFWLNFSVCTHSFCPLLWAQSDPFFCSKWLSFLYLDICLSYNLHSLSPASFDGLHLLLSSSYHQLLFSQDASLQGMLHPNGT